MWPQGSRAQDLWLVWAALLPTKGPPPEHRAFLPQLPEADPSPEDPPPGEAAAHARPHGHCPGREGGASQGSCGQKGMCPPPGGSAQGGRGVGGVPSQPPQPNTPRLTGRALRLQFPPASPPSPAGPSCWGPQAAPPQPGPWCAPCPLPPGPAPRSGPLCQEETPPHSVSPSGCGGPVALSSWARPQPPRSRL